MSLFTTRAAQKKPSVTWNYYIYAFTPRLSTLQLYSTHIFNTPATPRCKSFTRQKSRYQSSISSTMPSNREAREKELPPLLPKDTSELAVSKAFNLESLGTLSILPRELRDEIYSHMCNQTCPYRFVKPACWLTGLKWDGKGRFMLEVSKAVRKEFLTVLYSKGVFEMDQHSVLPYTQRSDIPFFNDISNI